MTTSDMYQWGVGYLVTKNINGEFAVKTLSLCLFDCTFIWNFLETKPMDDLRFRWLKDSIYTILNIDENDPAFEEFLEGEDGANELLIAKFLNEASSNVDEENALLFHKEVFEELREEQVEISNWEKIMKFYKLVFWF